MARMFRTLIAPAFVLVAFASSVSADYSYSASAFSFGAPLPFLATVTNMPGSISDAATATVPLFTLNYSNITAGSATTTFSFTETLTGTPGTETFNFTGTYQFVATANSVFAGFAVTGVTTTGSGYSIPNNLVNYFTTSGTAATVQATIIPSAVPEPASVAMLGLGLVGSLGFAVRRRLARA